MANLLLRVGRDDAYIWNLAATKGRENPTTRKVVRLMATGTLRGGPEGKGTVETKMHKRRF